MGQRLRSELSFIVHLMRINLSSAMEYRAAFLSQIVGMILNNGIYFVFWLLFFDQFNTVKGYSLQDVYLLFGLVALSFGLGYVFAGNTSWRLATLIAQGRLDYYLALPRNVLIHVLFSRMTVSTFGDITFGLFAFLFTGRTHLFDFLLFLLTSLISAIIFAGFGVITGSMAFFMGNAEHFSQQANNALLTFALYPNTLFAGFTRFLLYTLVPAAFVGAVPVTIITERNGLLLLAMIFVAMLVWGVGGTIFYVGLRRYESGSALNINI